MNIDNNIRFVSGRNKKHGEIILGFIMIQVANEQAGQMVVNEFFLLMETWN